MLLIQKYAAIDIGSNAVRLLIMNVIEEAGKPVVLVFLVGYCYEK